ncbi:larval cuticle protein A2B-like [Anopheles ziemanni]|uniref:larval cuticle protein A2B-like n=1 Tax=Anopheles coustani TaxID=139045 RepID=UPI00265B0A70|nr:larval cuticle protein A2B-like [Anopheles coustani]XP_058177618.1 larval cuticle protein A2B-like [Anopheles ziemanni]
MHSKICIVLLVGLAVANAAVLPVHHHDYEDHHSPVEYHFAYEVHDDHTGDVKSQHEERHGDKVTGQYSLVDADGYRRVVDYSSDKHTGFVAKVHREPVKGHHVVVAAPKKTHLVPAVHYVKTVAVSPVVHHVVPHVHHVEAVHHVEPVHHVELHHAVPQVHVLKPVVHLKEKHNAHSHTSFKSGNVSYQY